MRPRAGHLACLLLLLSSLAVSDACFGGAAPSRTPGGVFVRNLLLQAAIEEVEPATLVSGNEDSPALATAMRPLPGAVRVQSGAAAQSAHMHSVTGSSL